MTPAAGPARDELAGCPLCDALNRIAATTHRPQCWRCGSPLPAATPAAREAVTLRLLSVIALLSGAWVCLAAAHLFPLVALELQGQHNTVTLVGAARMLWLEGRVPLAAALFVTLVLAPLGEAAAMLLAASGLRARIESLAPGAVVGAPSRALLAALHAWQALRHWNLTEVLILAAAVALVKLGQVATLVVGPALVALIAFLALRLAAMRLLPPEQAWPLLEARFG